MSINRPADLAALNGLSHLDDPLRRQLYEYVIESDGPVSREQAAAAASIGRTLAAYHLDKLAEAGLLTVSYQRPGWAWGTRGWAPGQALHPSRPGDHRQRAAPRLRTARPPTRRIRRAGRQRSGATGREQRRARGRPACRRRNRGKRDRRAAQLRLPAPRRRRWPHQSTELPVSSGRCRPPRRGVRVELTPRRGGHRRVWSPARTRRTRSATPTGAAWWCTTRSRPHARVADADPIQPSPRTAKPPALTGQHHDPASVIVPGLDRPATRDRAVDEVGRA